MQHCSKQAWGEPCHKYLTALDSRGMQHCSKQPGENSVVYVFGTADTMVFGYMRICICIVFRSCLPDLFRVAPTYMYILLYGLKLFFDVVKNVISHEMCDFTITSLHILCFENSQVW